MIKTLTDLNYKRASEFNNEKMRARINYFIENSFQPPNTEYYVKIVEQQLIYETDSGDTFENSLALINYFLIDKSTEAVIDCFCAPAKPFQIRTASEITILNELYEIYISDLEKIMEKENEIMA